MLATTSKRNAEKIDLNLKNKIACWTVFKKQFQKKQQNNDKRVKRKSVKKRIELRSEKALRSDGKANTHAKNGLIKKFDAKRGNKFAMRRLYVIGISAASSRLSSRSNFVNEQTKCKNDTINLAAKKL